MGWESERSLKKIRQGLGLTMQKVEEASRKIAEAKRDRRFFLSTARLAQIESGSSLPGIHKLYSLSVIYGASFADLMRLYEVNLDETGNHADLVPAAASEVSRIEVHTGKEILTFPVRLDPSFNPNLTQSLSQLVEVWGEIPLAFFRNLLPTTFQYGYVGLQDRMMDPLIRPGSIVTVDTHRDKVQAGGWKSEFDRPIYFVELRDTYRCAWCELELNTLTVIPYPLSPCRTQRFDFPDEAEIVGQVVAVAMRLIPPGVKKAPAAPRRRALP